MKYSIYYADIVILNADWLDEVLDVLSEAVRTKGLHNVEIRDGNTLMTADEFLASLKSFSIPELLGTELRLVG